MLKLDPVNDGTDFFACVGILSVFLPCFVILSAPIGLLMNENTSERLLQIRY